MRLLTIIDSLAVGGAEQSLLTLAPHLMTRGVDVHVAYLAERVGIGEELAAAGATVHSLVGGGGRAGAFARTYRMVRSVQPDIAHTTLFEADVVGRVAARLGRVPVVSSFVTEAYGPEHYGNPEYHELKVRAAHITDAGTARLVTRFHAVSQSSADVMAQRLRIPRTKVQVIPRGRDVAKLGERTAERRSATRRMLGVADGQPLVLAAGRHFHFKGLDTLVAAMPYVRAMFPDVRLVVAGREGPATRDLREHTVEGDLADAVDLIGYRSDVADLMTAADVFVLPSRAEGSPGALLEAMALEAPIVATDIPSVREIAGAEEPTMVLTPRESPEQMANSIAGLLRDHTAAAELAAAARRRFLSKYTIDVIADQTVALYQSCLSRA